MRGVTSIMRTCLAVLMMLAVLAVTSPAPLAAAEEHDHKASEEKTLGVESGIFQGAVELSIWTILVFVILLVVLRKYAWGPILDGLARKREEASPATSTRRSTATQGLPPRSKAKTEAEMARASMRRDPRDDRQGAQQDAAATAAEELARGKAEVQAERDRLHHELRMEQDQAACGQDLGLQRPNSPRSISAKAIGKHLSDADHRALLDEALAEFRAAGQTRMAEVESAKA